MVALGLVAGLFAGGAVSGHALEYLAWRNSTSFNVTDPGFGLDVGFFVFDYPWWRLVLSFAFAAFVFSAIVAAIVHYMMGGLRFSGPRRRGSRAAQAHLSPGGTVVAQPRDDIDYVRIPSRRSSTRTTAASSCMPGTTAILC
jgi:uncharacterized protein